MLVVICFLGMQRVKLFLIRYYYPVSNLYILKLLTLYIVQVKLKIMRIPLEKTAGEMLKEYQDKFSNTQDKWQKQNIERYINFLEQLDSQLEFRFFEEEWRKV